MSVLGEANTTRPAQESAETEQQANPYGYPEFAGWSGEHYLKKLLRQILPMALYRTWEIFTDHQARDNECYLGLSQLSAIAQRAPRTMQKNLAALRAKHLLVERAVYKIFRTTDGAPKRRAVVVKDFSGLYTLAHEYHVWLADDGYVAPERGMVELLAQDPCLVARLRRFDNYRRVLYHHAPGPVARTREEDRWFTEYLPEEAAAFTEERHAKEAQSSKTDAPVRPPLAKASPKEVTKELAKMSPKRISESQNQKKRKRDSFDSAVSFSENPEKSGEEVSAHSACEARASGSQRGATPHALSSVRTQATKPPLSHAPEQETGGPRSLSPRESAERSPEVHRARQAMAMAGTGHREYAARYHATQTRAELPDHPLARSFVHEIARPFGDRNTKGSVTRVLRIIAQQYLETAEVLMCLIRAYTVARDTHKIRADHRHPETGQPNRMPLFCAMFEQFAQARVQGKAWNYSWQQVEDEIAADDRLLLWWSEQQALGQGGAAGQPEGRQAEAFVKGRPEAEKQQTDQELWPLAVGWRRQQSAHDWAHWLLAELAASGFTAEAQVRQVGERYQVVLLSEGEELVLETSEQVQFVIEQVRSENA